MERLYIALKGACMGFADAIPGVSGGTMALIVGVYSRFIAGLSALDAKLLTVLIKGAFWKNLLTSLKTGDAADDSLEAEKANHIAFLINLGVGILFGLLIGVAILPWLMEEHPEAMRAFFFGLVLASIIVPWSLMQSRRRVHGVLFVIACVGTWQLMGLQSLISNSAQTTVVLTTVDGKPLAEDYKVSASSMHFATNTGQKKLRREIAFQSTEDFVFKKGTSTLELKTIAAQSGDRANLPANSLSQILLVNGKQREIVTKFVVQQPNEAKGGSNPALWYTGLCGCIAICAMMLPGISGSFLLLMLGLYGYILTELRALLYTQDPASLMPVSVFMAGLIVGLIAFSKFLSWLLARAHDGTMAFLAGLMLGSLRALWPFKSGVATGMHNVLPSAIDDIVVASVIMFLVGLAIVTTLHRLGQRNSA